MAVGAGRQVFGRWVSWAAGAALLASLGCTGTEQAIFSAIEPPPPVSPPPAEPLDAAPEDPPPHDAGISDPRDAAPDDAGGLTGPELDPDVTFVWTETLPGQGTCKAGAYAGSFMCAVEQPDASAVASSLPVSGQVVFTLGDLSEAQERAVITGAIKDEITLGFVFNSGLRGALGCRDDHFTAQSVDGKIGFGTFDAALDGTFDPQALVIDGSFVSVDATGARCEGDFHVSALP